MQVKSRDYIQMFLITAYNEKERFMTSSFFALVGG